MPSESTTPAEPKRTSFALVLAVTLVSLVTIVCVIEHCREKVVVCDELVAVLKEERDEAYRQTSQLTIERDGLRVEVESCAGAVVRLHGELDKMKIETDALLLRVAELVDERDDAFGKVAELRELIVRIKLDRDNLANALADEKRDRDQLADAYADKVAEIQQLKNFISKEIDDNLSLQADLKCCEEQLARKPKCPCECPPRVEHKKPEKKRKHHR